MCILPCLLDPTLQTLKGLLIINAKGEENATNAFIERPHNGPKRLLSSLPSHKAYGIPDLHFDLHLLIDFDRFGAELHAYGHVVVVWEFALDVFVQKGCFAHAWVDTWVPEWPIAITLKTILSIVIEVDY